MTTKLCTKCATTKLLDAFAKDSSKRDGHASICKACKSAYMETYNRGHAEEKKQQSKEYRKEHAAEIKQYRKEYRARHVDERNQYNRQYYRDHPEVQKVRMKAYYIEHVAEYKQRCARYYINHADKYKQYYQRHAEERKQYAAQYRRDHPEASRAYKLKRRAAGVGRISGEVIRRIVSESESICPYCGGHIPEGKGHIDHMVPVSRGGTSDRSNLAYVCAGCNLRKGAKTVEEFLANVP